MWGATSKDSQQVTLAMVPQPTSVRYAEIYMPLSMTVPKSLNFGGSEPDGNIKRYFLTFY